ncbi:MAG: DUF1572 family protein [Flavobacteriales bacterium]|nr:DUF1572 family protein [Flavobacteriales bacterium]
MMKTAIELLKEEAIQHLAEGRGRLVHCLALLNEQQIWHRPNDQVVSVGNLVLHLCGNVDQWVNHTLGGDPNTRQRQAEFDTTGPLPTNKLTDQLARVMDRAIHVIGTLTDTRLVATYNVQVFRPSGVGILVHVTEHFSYHVGQVTLHTKLLLNVDTGYYAGHRL